MKLATFTVFLDDRRRFIGVPFDARTTNVSAATIGDWKQLNFGHLYSPNNTTVCSSVDCGEEHTRLAGGAPPNNTRTWIDNFFPQNHHNNGGVYPSEYPNATHIGLIGRLPLLLALAAFSCPSDRADWALRSCIRSGRRWSAHPYNGRKFTLSGMCMSSTEHDKDRPERGMVVTVWKDPRPSATSLNQLRLFERGEYGPIFGF
jgi:hypothetical protein